MQRQDFIISTRKKSLLLSFVFILFCASIFSGMGYYYLAHRNALMHEAVVKSNKASMGMFVQDLEKKIISLENRMILDVVLKRKNQSGEEGLSEIQTKYPIVNEIFFYSNHTSLQSLEKEIMDKKNWLIQSMEAEIIKSKPAILTLHHFSGIFENIPIQAGFIALPPTSPEEIPRFLIFTLDLDFIRNELLQESKKTAKISLHNIAIKEFSHRLILDSVIGKGSLLEVPFRDILSFWKVVASIDISGMSKRAKMEFILYSGIILIVFLLSVLSMYFIWRQMKHERKLSRVKSQMIFHVSHELKTPLSLIRMYSETLMLGRIDKPSKVKKYYQIILGECDRLHLLINNMLSLSKIEKGINEYNFSVGNVGEAVQKMIESYGFFLEQHGFKLHADIEENIPSFSFDKVALNQIVINLLDNAMKFSDEAKVIEVQLTTQSNNILLRVTDHGIGMTSNAKDIVFEPYHRLSTRYRGSGIGLSLVRHAVNAHQGTIQVTSKEGLGSTFVITIPLPENDDVV